MSARALQAWEKVLFGSGFARLWTCKDILAHGVTGRDLTNGSQLDELNAERLTHRQPWPRAMMSVPIANRGHVPSRHKHQSLHPVIARQVARVKRTGISNPIILPTYASITDEFRRRSPNRHPATRRADKQG
jgi:hypothetical protein